MEVSFLSSATQKEHYPKSPLPQIAFAGRSNVGKSSLINSLLGRKKLAKTSSTPGRTQLINFFSVNGQWIFVDLPGYGFARVPQAVRRTWGPMIEEYLSGPKGPRLTILIVDARHGPTELDLVMKDYLDRLGLDFQVVATKIDKVSSNRRRGALAKTVQALGGRNVIPYSSATGIGKKELWRLIREV